MLELTIYGLVGLAAMLVIVFYFACADEFRPIRKRSPLDLVDNADLSNSRAMETRTEASRG
jgi:hypothetical protein